MCEEFEKFKIRIRNLKSKISNLNFREEYWP